MPNKRSSNVFSNQVATYSILEFALQILNTPFFPTHMIRIAPVFHIEPENLVLLLQCNLVLPSMLKKFHTDYQKNHQPGSIKEKHNHVI